MVAQYGLGFEALHLDPKTPDANGLEKLFRFLARRELEPPLAEQCRHAVEQFTAKGGKLLDGFTLSAQAAGLSCADEGAAVVPRHKASIGCRTVFHVTF